MNSPRLSAVRAGALVALAFAVPAVGAAAQDARLAAQLDAGTEQRVSAVIERARAASLPVEPLVDKALEGARKRAPAPRIVEAVTGLAARLESSRVALGMASTEAELVAAAAALQAGVGPRVLSQLRQARAGKSLAVPLVVLGDLVSRGVPHDTASALILLVAHEGLGDETLLAIQRDVQRDVRDGAHPATAAAIRARGAVSGAST
ncbi:MAG TPA: hypothetical protein VG432_03910, partial [Gemmatimonadaceae bacterium]|nr:hypothetical protein [Gemmatimonadaceae bacterium]